MENALSVSVSPLQVYLALAFQIWAFIVFPVIVIRKLNYITDMLHDKFYPETQSETDS